ncbi:hypothetical protein JJB99_31640 [Bradyrhizobium diazoefficiens]|nr:hypothetical protein [Bradyrhizobium diazoefficiens]QQO13863.1 hypothetical protein JJB99_31640 [Bradyrhizobium diazoefficiens]
MRALKPPAIPAPGIKIEKWTRPLFTQERVAVNAGFFPAVSDVRRTSEG